MSIATKRAVRSGWTAIQKGNGMMFARSKSMIFGLAATLLFVTGCPGAAAARIVMSIGREVVVTVGADLVEKIIDGQFDNDHAAVTINYTDANESPATEVYQVAETRALTIGSDLDGEVVASGDGSGHITVTVPAGTTAEIGFNPTEGGAPDNVAPDDRAEPVDTGAAPDDNAKAAEFLQGTWRGV